MGIEAGAEFLPADNKNPLLIYSRVNQRHASLDPYRFMEYPHIDRIGEYITAPVAYLGLKSADWRLRDLGGTMWNALDPTSSENMGVRVALTENPIYDILSAGTDPWLLFNEVYRQIGEAGPVNELTDRITAISKARSKGPELTGMLEGLQTFEQDLNHRFPILMEPKIMYSASGSGPAVYETTRIYLHPQHIITCRERPLDAAAAVVYLASRVRDYKYGRAAVDGREVMHDRAKLYEAHFVLECLHRKPEIELNDFTTMSLVDFPQGFKTPGLAPELLYKAPRTIGRG